ncbi:MAG: gephyrin-like molybdotransferase Glp [Pseudomonadota bacterium]
MISVAQALDHLFALVSPLPVEDVPLRQANGRVLGAEVCARRTQPPFDASAMDGYAVKGVEVERDALFKVVGEAAAGHGWSGTLRAGHAVRIFTGAPLPAGADHIVIQEDVTRRDDLITITADPGSQSHVRKAGIDFAEGDVVAAPRRLGAPEVALLAAMNVAMIPARRKPVVALISTGDELVMPGEAPGPDQIVASNTFGLAAMLERIGAEPRLLPIARDNPASVKMALDLAAKSDLIVTIGGASVGDHDIVADVAEDHGLDQSFYKIAMRPGKPLMAGKLGDTPMIGLPGNPVSALVCGTVFLAPVIRVMLGFPPAPTPRREMPLSKPLSANGPREHYMRGISDQGAVRDAGPQDSSLLRVLAASNVLIVRPPHDVARDTGERVEIIDL